MRELKEVTREGALDHVAAGGGAFFILNEKGDTKTIWDRENEEEVEAAEAMWDRLVTNGGYLGYRVGEEGEKKEQMESFDPKAGKIILAPKPKMMVAG